MDNTSIETQPIGRVEIPSVSEAPAEIGAIEVPSTNFTEEVATREDIASTQSEASTGGEIAAQAPKPSVGFSIDSKKTGASRIVLEKLTGYLENL